MTGTAVVPYISVRVFMAFETVIIDGGAVVAAVVAEAAAPPVTAGGGAPTVAESGEAGEPGVRVGLEPAKSVVAVAAVLADVGPMVTGVAVFDDVPVEAVVAYGDGRSNLRLVFDGGVGGVDLGFVAVAAIEVVIGVGVALVVVFDVVAGVVVLVGVGVAASVGSGGVAGAGALAVPTGGGGIGGVGGGNLLFVVLEYCLAAVGFAGVGVGVGLVGVRLVEICLVAADFFAAVNTRIRAAGAAASD